MNFSELVSPSLTELFVKEIERMIISGALKIGEKLPTERQLSEQMKVSRAVINGGINKLAAKGFLRIAPRKGVFVEDYIRNGDINVLHSIVEYSGTQFLSELMGPIWRFRRAVEPDALELAATNINSEQVYELTAIVANLKSTRNTDQFANLYFVFYHTVSLASKNPIWPLIIRTFQTFYISLTKVFISGEGFEKLTYDLECILDYLKAGNGYGAKEYDLKAIDNYENYFNSHFHTGDSFATSDT